MKTTILFALAIATSAATIMPTVANATEPVAVTKIVPIAGLDLTSATGHRELDRRIHRAAREVCGTTSDADLKGKNDIRQCRAESIAAATAQRQKILAAGRVGMPIAIASAD